VEITAYWSDPTDNSNISSGEYPVTSTLFGFQDDALSAGTVIGYFFTDIEGFSKFGKYTGNANADGPFVWCGFRPSFLLWKSLGNADDWNILDDQRSPYNVADLVLEPDTADAEVTGSPREIDLLSNGFKVRGSDTNLNGSGQTLIFAAFAETAFKTATAR
jgi:hypothetical protein